MSKASASVATGGSQLTVNVSGRSDVDARGNSRVTYLGSPTLGTIDSSSDSSVGPEKGSLDGL